MPRGEMSAEMALAEAVVHQAIKDALEGSPQRRRQALADIANGCLDYWVELVCSEGRGRDVLLDALHTALPRAVRS